MEENFDQLDAYSFKAFWYAARELNFTEAAKSAGLTQSGISQHIQSLETQLQTSLFKRVNKKVYLTDSGFKLKKQVEKYLELMSEIRNEISNDQFLPSGLVRYAMPPSCLRTEHLDQMLMRRNKKFSEIKFDIKICSSIDVIELIKKTEVDFGFTTEFRADSGIELIPFCKEEYILVSRKKINHLTQDLSDLSFIEYPGVEDLFEAWKKKQKKLKKRISWNQLSVTSRADDLLAVKKLVKAGVGVTIIPKHCVHSELQEKKLHAYCQDQSSALNQIYIATRKNENQPKRVQICIETLLAVAH